MKCLPSQARCLKTFFLLCFKPFCLGTCFLQRVPLRECTLCLLGSHSLLYPEAPEGQQSHQCGILAHGKVGLIPPITIGLNLYLDFSPRSEERRVGKEVKISVVAVSLEKT